MKGFAAKRRKYQRILVILLLPALVLFHFTTPVWAVTLNDADGYQLTGYKLNGGISTIYYSWYNPHNYTPTTGTGYYSLAINAADVYAGCRFYSNSGLPVSDGDTFGAPWNNYKYVYVICYHQELLELSQNSQTKAVFSHEIGHVLGLDHVEPFTGRSIMENPIVNKNISEQQPNDVNGVSHVGY